MQPSKATIKRPNSKPGRVSLVPSEFQNILEDQGCQVRVTPTLLCPNITDLETYNHELSCPICDNGIVDLDDKSFEAWALIQSIGKDKRFDNEGIFDMRDAQMTIQADHRVNYWYKVEVLAFTTAFNQLIVRGVGDFDKTRYVIQNEASYNKWYLIDKVGNRYEKDTHFSIGVGGITWLSPTRPAEGMIYSFSYPILPTYRVLDLMHENRYYYEDFKKADKTPVHLPQQAHIRFDFFVKGGGYEKEAPTLPPGAGSPPPFKTGFGG